MAEIKRVLQVVGKMHYGGMETLIMNIYRNIDREKLQFDFLVHYTEKGEYDDEIEELGGNIYYMPKTELANIFIYKTEIKKFFSQHHNYVCVHGHLHNAAFLYLKEAKKYQIPTIEHIHNSGIGRKIKDRIGFLTTRLGIKYADYLFSCSDEATKFYFGEKMISKAIVLKNGIDVSKYALKNEIRDRMRKKYKVEHDFVILHVGRFSKQKNHEYLIDIYKKVVEKKQNTHLFLIGEGEMKPYIEKKVKKMGLDEKITFLGGQKNINEWMMMADCFLLPSLYEGLPLVLIESQTACLKSVISTKVPNEVVLTNTVFYLSLENNEKEWAEEILNISFERNQDTVSQVREAGFDIIKTSKYLENWYIKRNICNK